MTISLTTGLDRHPELRQEQRLGDEQVLRCQIAYNEFGGFCVPTSSLHRPAARKILAGQVHEPQTIAFVAAHGEHGDIVHAGAYFGDFLPGLSRACAPAYRIWAFEPNHANYRL